jgi:hypothetical protein
MTRLSSLAVSIVVSLAASESSAYSVQTPVTAGCHEDITAAALRRTRAALPDVVKALPSRGDDDALIGDAPFDLPPDLDDIGGITLLLGARDNDMKDLSVTDFDRIAIVTADPKAQREHCLRAPEHDEPDGSRRALEACRAFIREMLLSALEGLDETGRPDGNRRERLEVTLDIRGTVKVDVPMFYLRAGRALHALEDSFTHTFRSKDDPTKVTVVLNWVDYAEKRLDEARDGPAHSKELDRCDNPDALRRRRRELATESATAALHAVLNPATDAAGKAVAVDAVLDQYLSFAGEGCTHQNDWCDAPELEYQDSGCGCHLAPRPRSTPAWLACVAALAVLARLRRTRVRWHDASRRPTARQRKRVAAAASAAVLASLLLPRALFAAEPDQEKPSGFNSAIEALKGRSDAGAPGKKDVAGAFFGRVAGGASYHRPGLSAGVGARYQMGRAWMFGADTEWNPWIASSRGQIRTGVINGYLSVIRRFQMEFAPLNIRSTAALGASVLMIDLVGAPAGSFGPFFGLSFVGVEWKWAPGFYLTIDPTYIAFPVPHLTGAPFGYLQYRFLVGLEFGG